MREGRGRKYLNWVCSPGGSPRYGSWSRKIRTEENLDGACTYFATLAGGRSNSTSFCMYVCCRYIYIFLAAAIYRHHIVEIHFALLYSTIAWTRTSFLSGRGLTFTAWVLSADCRVVTELEGLFQDSGAELSF